MLLAQAPVRQDAEATAAVEAGEPEQAEAASPEQASRADGTPPRWHGLRSLFKRPPRQAAEQHEGDSQEAAQEEAEEEPPPFANSVDFNPLPVRPDGDEPLSDAIFAEVGRQLRARREMLGLTHEEIERHIKVRVAFLKALEDGSMEGLPSPVQTRGILANYASFIDLDTEALLLRFADGLQRRHRENRPNWPPRTRSPMTVNKTLPPLRVFIASDLLFGGGAAIMLMLFAIWGINRVLAERAARPVQATAPSISDVLAGTPMPTVPNEITLIAPQSALLTTATAFVQELPATPSDPTITVQVKLTSSERTYIRVTVDDKPMFEGRAEPGKDYYYQAVRQVEVVVGNGAAVTVMHNGKVLGLMGTYGEVVDRIYTAHGAETPTPTAAPTRTPTQTPTSTEKPTPTLATYTPTTKPEDR